MPPKLGLLVVAVIVVFVCASASASTSQTARSTASCSILSLNAGKSHGGRHSLRLVAIGVSCAETKSLVESFYRKVAGGHCGRNNMYCNLQFPGKWDCGFFFATESKATGGAIAGCFRTTREKLRLFPVGGKASAVAAAVPATLATSGRSCGSTPLQVQPRTSVRVTIIRGSLSCARARAVARLYGSRGISSHSFPARSLGYTVFPGGWVCGALSRGNAECVRGGLGSLKHGMTFEATRNAHEAFSLVLD
jgi:hypothetical protein